MFTTSKKGRMESVSVTGEMAEKFQKFLQQEQWRRDYCREYMRKKREENKEEINAKKREWYRKQKEREASAKQQETRKGYT